MHSNMNIAHTGSVIIRVRRPGDPPLHVDPQSGAALTRVILTSVDLADRAITVTTRDGRVVTRRIVDTTDVSTLRKGDQIDVMYIDPSARDFAAAS